MLQSKSRWVRDVLTASSSGGYLASKKTSSPSVSEECPFSELFFVLSCVDISDSYLVEMLVGSGVESGRRQTSPLRLWPPSFLSIRTSASKRRFEPLCRLVERISASLEQRTEGVFKFLTVGIIV